MLRYVWIIALREFLRARSIPVHYRADALPLLFVLALFVVAPYVLVSTALWVLTGRGPGRWIAGQAFVNPFPRPLAPAEVRSHATADIEARAAIFTAGEEYKR